MNEDLEKFKLKAEQLGAKLEVEKGLKNYKKFTAWESSEMGDCGSPGCHCSPGLWVSGGQSQVVVIAHFGKDWERGGEGYFTRTDYMKWCQLVDFVHKELKG